MSLYCLLPLCHSDKRAQTHRAPVQKAAALFPCRVDVEAVPDKSLQLKLTLAAHCRPPSHDNTALSELLFDWQPIEDTQSSLFSRNDRAQVESVHGETAGGAPADTGHPKALQGTRFWPFWLRRPPPALAPAAQQGALSSGRDIPIWSLTVHLCPH